MQVRLNTNGHTAIAAEFQPWKPLLGNVFSSAFAFDCETTLIDESRPWLVPKYVLGGAFDGRRGFFVAPNHLQQFFLAHSDVAVVMHNAPFDLGVINLQCPDLDLYGRVDRNEVWDTRILHQLLTLAKAGTTASGSGDSTLERCAELYAGIRLPKDERDAQGDVIRLSYGKYHGSPLREIPEIYLRYLAHDVIATHMVFVQLRQSCQMKLANCQDAFGYVSPAWLQQQKERWGPFTHHIQLRAAIVLAQITANGLAIDNAKCDRLIADLTAVAHELSDRLRQYGCLPGQPSCQNAMQGIMRRLERKHQGCRFPKTATGKYATSAEALEELAGSEPFVDDFLKFGAVQKLLSTFVEKMNAPSIHPSFNPLLVTGRTSSFGAINAQNLPRDPRVRRCFVPSPGHVFVDADYATIEMATLAQSVISQFKIPSKMADAINRGDDLHRLVAAQVTGKPEAEVTDEERRKAKPINFGKPGGMGSEGLKRYAKASYGVDLTDDEVDRLSDAWLRQFPEMDTFLRNDSELGEATARLLDLSAQSYFDATNDDQYLRQCRTSDERISPSKYLGWMLLKSLKEANPSTQKGRPYSQAELDFFWGRLIDHQNLLPNHLHCDVQHRCPSLQLWGVLRNLADRAPCITFTGRLRANASYCARRNTLFQGLAADGAKLALWRLWRAGYRLVNFVHDEVLIEVPDDEMAAQKAEHIREIMVVAMREVVPDVAVKVEHSICHSWSKSSTPAAATNQALLV